MCAIILDFLLFFVGSVIAATITGSSSVDNTPLDLSAVSVVVVVVVVPLLLLLFTGALAYWSAELSGRAKRAKKNCCGDVGPGVEFQGSHGSARDFIFSNSSYLSEFLDANPRKSRSDIRRV